MQSETFLTLMGLGHAVLGIGICFSLAIIWNSVRGYRFNPWLFFLGCILLVVNILQFLTWAGRFARFFDIDIG